MCGLCVNLRRYSAIADQAPLTLAWRRYNPSGIFYSTFMFLNNIKLECLLSSIATVYWYHVGLSLFLVRRIIVWAAAGHYLILVILKVPR